MQLSGKVALVTGGSQGIGEGIALRLADEGADIVIDYFRHPDDANKVADQIRNKGRRAATIQANVGSVGDIQALFEEAVQQLGQVDILVNNAGIEKNASFVDVTETDYDAVVNINLKGAFFGAQALARHLIGRKQSGSIINISSVHEELPFPHFTPYCVSKGGMKMMMRNIAIELAPHGITVNNIAPGAIETPINTALLHDPKKLNALLANIPLGRLGKPKDVASVVAFLASEDAAYITGTTIFVDGGLMWNYSEQ